MASVQESLASAGLEYVDLLLVHAPIDVENRVDHWKALEAIKQEGRAKKIGLAYMNNTQLADFIKNCTVIPAVLELEFSPFGQNDEVVEFCIDNGIALLVDEPSVKNMRHSHPDVVDLSVELSVTVDELLMRYVLSKELMGVLMKPSYLDDPRCDLHRLQMSLPRDTVSRLDALEEGLYSTWDPKEDLGDDIK